MFTPHPSFPLAPFLVGVLLLASGLSGACASPPLSGEPWEYAQAGTWGVGLHPSLFTLYQIDGEFITTDFATGDPILSLDDGDIEGRFGAALRGEYFLTSRLSLSLGADYRVYDIEGLTPTPELATAVDRIESLQYFAALRYLLPPFESIPRLRPWAGLGIAWLPGVDVGFEVDLSEYGSDNIRIDTTGESYLVGAVSAGVLYHWRDRWVVELGLLYETPLNPLEADLGFDIGPSHVPIDAEFEPSGFVGFVGITAYF
jgi:hypothetical protein